MSGDGTSEVDRRILDLHGLLASSQDRIDLLQKEIAFHRAHIALMREALMIARSTIEMQERRRGRARLQTTIGRVRSAKTRINKIFSLVRFRRRHSSFVSRAVLENILLRAARAKMRGIEGVVIEYHDGPLANWRVCGIASGKVDADLAKIAVLEAAANLAAYALVADVDDKTVRQPKMGFSIGGPATRLKRRKLWLR